MRPTGPTTQPDVVPALEPPTSLAAQPAVVPALVRPTGPVVQPDVATALKLPTPPAAQSAAEPASVQPITPATQPAIRLEHVIDDREYSFALREPVSPVGISYDLECADASASPRQAADTASPLQADDAVTSSHSDNSAASSPSEGTLALQQVVAAARQHIKPDSAAAPAQSASPVMQIMPQRAATTGLTEATSILLSDDSDSPQRTTDPVMQLPSGIPTAPSQQSSPMPTAGTLPLPPDMAQCSDLGPHARATISGLRYQTQHRKALFLYTSPANELVNPG